MGNPLQTIPNLPPAIGLSGAEQLWVNQAGVDRRTTAAAVASLMLGQGEGGLSVGSYDALRNSAFPVTPGHPAPVVTLTAPGKAGLFVPVPLLVSQPFMARDNGGTVIVDANGQPWQRVYEDRVNAAWFYNAPAPNYFGDNSGVTITAEDLAANPQWIGMPDGSGPYPVGTLWDYVCLQEWLYCCSAIRSTPLSVLWNITYGSYQLNQPGYCPGGLYRINQQLMLNATGANIEFASRRGTYISWYGNKLGTDASTPAFLMNSLAYSQIRNLTMQDQVGCETCLVSIDHQPAYGGFAGGLSPQLNTFSDWFIGGTGGGVLGGPTWGGIGIALAGGAAQGDTQQFVNLFIGQCQNGVVLGGDNAIGALFVGGDMTNCTRGVANLGAGSFTAINLLTEGDTYNYYGYPHADQITMDGADFFSSEVSTESSLVIGNRSESMVFAIDYNYLLEVQTSAIAYAGVSKWQANAHFHTGYGLGVAGNGYNVVVLADDGGPPWFLGTLSADGITITAYPGTPAWTVNQWANYGIWLRYGSNGFTQSNGVVSNTANTITLFNPYPRNLTYPLGFKLFLSGGPTEPAWGTVLTPATDFGRTSRNASGGQWSTTMGSNVVQGPMPPVNTWAMVCGADLFTLQSVTGSPAMPGPLFGKVASNTPACAFQGYVTGTTLTVQSVTTGGGVIAIGTSVTGGGSILRQLTGPAGGAGIYQLDTPGMYPVAAQFWSHITTPGQLVVEQMYSGTIATGQTIAPQQGFNGTAQITGQISGTTGGAGVYSITDTTQTMSRIWTEAGVAGTVTAMSTTQSFTLVDNAGNPVNAGVVITNGQGYWSKPIADGSLTWMAVDFDVLFGIKRTRGVQIGGYGKFATVGEVELDYGTPAPFLTSNMLRDSVPNGLASPNYRPHPDIGMTPPWTGAAPSPYTLGVGPGTGQIGSTKALYFYVPASATLNFPVLQPNLSMDLELVLQSWAATPPVVTWGANVRPVAPTLTLGAQGQLTIVRLKWFGAINQPAGGSVGSWLVTSVQGPV